MKLRSSTTVLTALLLVSFANSCLGQRFGRRFFRGPRNSTPATEQVTVPTLRPSPLNQSGNRRFALIVAIREYPHSNALPSLPGTNADAKRLATVLQRGGYNADDVILVYDEAETPEFRPTRANILAQLERLFTLAAEKDSVAVFVTGHGVTLKETSYFCPSDATDTALSDPELALAQLVSIKELASKLSEDCHAAHRMLVVDACRDTTANRTTGYIRNVASLEKPAEDVWIMSSCSEGQFSWMSNRLGDNQRHALFSHYLAEGLEGAADLLGDNDGEVGLFEMYSYAFVKTRNAANEIGKFQTPELFGLAGPFTVATTGSFVAQRKLTTSDPAAEASRSAAQLADDVVLNLRAADGQYRAVVSADGVTPEKIEESSQNLHRYLCHLLGNRIEAALELDTDCKLAHVAEGLCYRTCGMYEESLAAFLRGDETFDLFVKANPELVKHYIAHDEKGVRVQYDNGAPVPLLAEGLNAEGLGTVPIFAKPGDEKPIGTVVRQAKVRIVGIQGNWLLVAAVNDQPLLIGGWIERDEVHWFPEGIDMYTPSSPMHPGSGTRLDDAASRINDLSARLAGPARKLENLTDIVGRPIDNANRVIGGINNRIPFFSPLPYLPNYPRNIVGTAAAYARIPSNYVAVAGGYAQWGSNAAHLAHTAQFWSQAAGYYYDSHEQSEKTEKERKKLKNAGKLKRVERRHVTIAKLPWPNSESR